MKGERQGIPAPPNTLEGWSVLHQMFRIRRRQWRKLDTAERSLAVSEAAQVLESMESSEQGQSAALLMLGHKGDLIVVHFRRTFDELAQAQWQLSNLRLSDFLEPAASYLSVVEIGLYESTVELYRKLESEGVKPYSEKWMEAVKAEAERMKNKLGRRLWPKIPERRYLCFYPMSRKRGEERNWYLLPIEERRRLMRDHGLAGRRYAGEVTQIISGSVGFDDWEWGVDLFADDPLSFKRLVYEMRFDEASAAYAEFGPFYVGIRIKPSDLSAVMGEPDAMLKLGPT